MLNMVPHQSHLLKGLSNNVLQFGVEADVYNLESGEFYSPIGNALPQYIRFIQVFKEKSVATRRIKKELFYFVLLFWFARRYEVVDFQGLFAWQYAVVIPKLRKKGLKIKTNIWGSDFYRLKDCQRQKLVPCFDYSNIIQVATEQIKEDFLKTYPQYQEKIRVARFGLSQLDSLLKMMDDNTEIDGSFLGVPDGKVVITCGYNAMTAQRHLQIIDALSSLPNEVKNRLYLLFPMTYGGTPEYKKNVEIKLKHSSLNGKIIFERLRLEQLISLRIRTDIAVNIQETDALAASLQEHIMAGSLLVVGDWLPYQIFDDNGIYIRRTSLEDLTSNILWAIENYKDMRKQLEQNKNKLYQLSSWKAVSPIWADIYKGML